MTNVVEQTSNDLNADGEKKFKSRNNSLLGFHVIHLVVILAAAFASGKTVNMYLAGTLPLAVPIIAWAVLAVIFCWYAISYFKRIDEVDLLDNLWASTIGFYTALGTTISWYYFHKLGILSEPKLLLILFAAFIALLATYFVRQFAAR